MIPPAGSTPPVGAAQLARAEPVGPRLPGYASGRPTYARTGGSLAARHLDGWLRRLDSWIAYANSVVEA